MLQHVAKAVLGEDLLLFPIFPSRPVVQMFDPKLEDVAHRMRRYIPHNTEFGLLSGSEEFVPFAYDPAHVDTCFTMFEQFGSHNDPSFKHRAQSLVRDFVDGTNARFRCMPRRRAQASANDNPINLQPLDIQDTIGLPYRKTMGIEAYCSLRPLGVEAPYGAV